MPAPTEAEVQAMLQNGVALWWNGRNFFDGTQVALFDTYLQALEGESAVPLGAAFIQAYRGAGAAAVGPGIAFAAVQPALVEYGRTINSPGYPRDLPRIMSDLWRYFRDNTKTIKSRNLTVAAGSFGGSNVGNGSLSRLVTDEGGFKIETMICELKSARCVQDQNTGARKHAERWILFGEDASPDALDETGHGSGAGASIYSHHAGEGLGNGGSLARNGSWSTYDASGTVTTKFPGWTISTLGNVTQETSIYFRGFPGSAENLTGSGIPDASLKFTADATLTQRIGDVGVTLDPTVPYFMRVMLYRQSSATGTVTIRCGASSASVALSSLTNATWTELLIAIGTANWPKNMTEQNLDIEVGVASLATSTFLMDDLLLAPFDAFGGCYWFLRGGSTAWLLDDSWSGTDSQGTDAKIQNCLRRAGLGYLPSTTGTPTIAEPA